MSHKCIRPLLSGRRVGSCVQGVQQHGRIKGLTEPASEPSKSHISYRPSFDYGSQLQRMQALRMEDSAEAWEGMPRSDNVRSFMQRMSSDKLRRLESALQRSPSLTVPSEVGRPACSRNARNMSCHLIRLPGQCHPRHLTDALLSKTSGLLVHVVKDVTTGICGRSADGTELKSSAWCSHSF